TRYDCRDRTRVREGLWASEGCQIFSQHLAADPKLLTQSKIVLNSGERGGVQRGFGYIGIYKDIRIQEQRISARRHHTYPRGAKTDLPARNHNCPRENPAGPVPDSLESDLQSPPQHDAHQAGCLPARARIADHQVLPSHALQSSAFYDLLIPVVANP